MKKYMGREWKWWLFNNDHKCKFCADKNIRMSIHTGYDYQGSKGFWSRAYHKWLKHMKEYHPEVLAQFK